MPKIIDAKTAAAMIKPNDRVMFGSFLAVGCAETIVDEMVKLGTKDLHLICIASDYDDKGVGKLLSNKQIKSAQVSHLGTNKAIQEQYNNGEIEVEMVPQGTLMERIRAKGAGLGGVLTPTGLGTIVEEGKEILTIDGKEFLLEKPIGAEWAVIKAEKADKMGNLVYSKTARNANPVMATAAEKVIVEVNEIVEIGEINPEDVITPGIFIDYIVKV
ncbi:MAG: CoA transferase subunit A [Candidatus Cloacimonadales bacterium]|jgi:3-oxoacid CoA-transferase A subunit|nr:CoA transferase subunit A [Candidatus Cloacimonadota bacterium]MDD2650885.1 CoA transferase subunit A [Candidatus Cloacimonadota bacterium]MDX9977705.1 CoA transferase subunit A [Candidatus Cloacimonadales bacterium]